jgi:hypothetical protein
MDSLYQTWNGRGVKARTTIRLETIPMMMRNFLRYRFIFRVLMIDVFLLYNLAPLPPDPLPQEGKGEAVLINLKSRQ